MNENGRQHGNDLTPKQTRAMLAMLEHPTLSDAEAAVGIGESTLYRWAQAPAFKTVYMDARREVVRQSIAHLQNTTGEAVTCLRECNKDTDASLRRGGDENKK
jgi:hypothetical protein